MTEDHSLDDADMIVQLLDNRAVRFTVKRFSYRHPALAEDFAQEAALTIVEGLARILRARHLNAFLGHVVRCACSDLLRRHSRAPNRDRRRPAARRPAPRRRDFQDVVRDLDSREPRPDFLAALREELGPDLAAVPPPSRPAPAAAGGNHLTGEQRATLRAIIIGEPGWSRQEVAAEFRRRTGRVLHPERVSDHRRALGLPPADPAAMRRRRLEAGAYDRWDCRVPRVV